MATEKTAEGEEKETEKEAETEKEEGKTSAMGALDSLEVSDDDFVWNVCGKKGFE